MISNNVAIKQDLKKALPDQPFQAKDVRHEAEILNIEGQ
jgi:hypothetical protein